MITIKAGQSKLIPIDLYTSPGSFPRKRESRNWIPNIQGHAVLTDVAGLKVGNDGVSGKRLDIVLAGEGASVEVIGLVLGKLSEEKTFEANITHAAPNTKSDVRVKGVLRGRSKFDFRGNVRIEKGAKGSNAYLRSDVLLFDEAKMGDDTPALEILEPDVKAGHAATIGKVDEQMVFYLMSRGLTRSQAEKLIIEGFVGSMRERIGKPAGSYFDASGSIRTRVKERSLTGDNGGEIIVKS